MGDKFSLDDVEVGAADATVGNADQDLPACWLRGGIVREDKRIGFDGGGSLEEAGFHGGDTPTPGILPKESASC